MQNCGHFSTKFPFHEQWTVHQWILVWCGQCLRNAVSWTFWPSYSVGSRLAIVIKKLISELVSTGEPLGAKLQSDSTNWWLRNSVFGQCLSCGHKKFWLVIMLLHLRQDLIYMLRLSITITDLETLVPKIVNQVVWSEASFGQKAATTLGFCHAAALIFPCYFKLNFKRLWLYFKLHKQQFN